MFKIPEREKNRVYVNIILRKMKVESYNGSIEHYSDWLTYTLGSTQQ